MPCPPLRSAAAAETQAPEYLPAPRATRCGRRSALPHPRRRGAWAELPEAVRRRFSKCLAPDETLIYRGHVVATRAVARRARSLLSRPRHRRAAAADRWRHRPGAGRRHRGSAAWRTELAAHLHPPRTLPAGHPLGQALPRATGLEEYVGCGIGMSLRVTVEAARSSSARPAYFLELGRWRLPIAARARSRPHADRAPRRGRRDFHLRAAVDAPAARLAGASGGHFRRRLSALALRRGMRL